MAEIEPPQSLVRDVELAVRNLERPKVLPPELESTARDLHSRALSLADRFSEPWHSQRFVRTVARITMYNQEVRQAISPQTTIEGKKVAMYIVEMGQRERSDTPTPHEIDIGTIIYGDDNKRHNLYTIKEEGTYKDNLLVKKGEYEEVNNVLDFIEQLLESRQ